MFLFKKIISQFLFPLQVIVFMNFIGLVFLWFTRKQKISKILVTAGIGLLIIFSYRILPDIIIRPLEEKFQPYTYSQDTLSAPPIRYVVVLGGGHLTDPSVPLTSQIGVETLTRLVEGIRIHRYHPGSKLILSGGKTYDPVTDAELMFLIAVDLGVDPNGIILEAESRDTKDEAIIIKSIVGDEAFALVTSAVHMPRAMGMFKKQGLNPIPAPTNHLYKRKPRIRPTTFFPSSGNLMKSERAIRECMGILWARIRNQI